MAVDKPSKGNSPKLPATEPKKAPNSEPKKPQDNAAATQSPKETQTAVNNTFGNLPADGSAKQPANTAKEPPPKPGTPVTNADGQPVKTPDGRSVVLDKNRNPVPVESDGKATADPKGNPYAVDQTGKYVETEDGNYGVYDKNGHTIAVNPVTGKASSDAGGNPYMVLPDGKYAKTASGEYVVLDKNTGDNPVAIDAKSGQPVRHPGSNVLAVGKDGNYLKSPDGGYNVVYNGKDDNKLAIVDPKTGQVSADTAGNAYKVQPDGQYARTDSGNYIVHDKNSGNHPAAIDPNTGTPVQDAGGNTLAVGADNQFIKTEDGQNVIYDKENGGKLAVIDPASGKVAQDGSGNPQVVLPSGKYAVTETGNPVVWDKANAGKPVAIDPKTGEAVKDTKGNILAVNDEGNFIKTPDGNAVVYDKVNNKYNLVANDKDDNPMVYDGFPAAVDQDGNYRKSANQEPLVYDTRGNTVVLGQDGKIVTDQKGNALAVDKDGNLLPDVVYDKDSGFRAKAVDGDVQKNDDGIPFAVDENGKMFLDENGKAAIYDPRGVPVHPLGTTTPSGEKIYKDATTGEQVGVTGSGYVFKVDPGTGELARDADGKLLPALYDPVNSDPTRPPVKPNDRLDTILSKFPAATGRGDPMAIKDELFDKNGNLDSGKIVEAAAKYDARDIYDALINSSKHGGWDNFSPELTHGGDLVHPNAEQAKQAIAAVIAWQNENGKYSPLKKDKVPAIVFYGGKPLDDSGYTRNGDTYVNVNLFTGSEAATIFHELNHASTSEAFKGSYGATGKHTEIITEFLATNWTGEGMDSAYESDYPHGMRSLEGALKKMGNGDVNTGMDILKRAYFAGDPAALEQLKKHFPPGQDFIPPEYSEYSSGGRGYTA